MDSFALSHESQWRRILMEDSVTATLRESLPTFLKQAAHAFIASVPSAIDRDEDAALNRWYESAEGQLTLVSFIDQLWAQMHSFAEHAMPGHDARHAVYKVPATALEYAAAEGVAGWGRVGILGALLHDHGRWAEERIYGHPAESVLHARLGYLLGKELLDKLAMPERIKQHILLATVRHSSGASPGDPMPLKLTVAADRDQLYGPEIILRLAHYHPGPDGDCSSFYGEKPGPSVLDRLTRFLCNRLPGPLFSRTAEMSSLWDMLKDFVLMSEDATASRRRLDALRLSPNAASSSLDWATEWARADAMRPICADPAAALGRLIAAPHCAPSERYRQAALAKLDALPAGWAERLGGALVYAEAMRQTEDLRQERFLAETLRSPGADALTRRMADLLLRGWRPAPSLSEQFLRRTFVPGEAQKHGSAARRSLEA